MFEQAKLLVEDGARFEQVRAGLEQIFAAGNVRGYLRRLKSSKVRVRDFERALSRGFLGSEVAQSYAVLGDADRGQIREFYLSLVERVAPELRAEFFEIYAYY